MAMGLAHFRNRAEAGVMLISVLEPLLKPPVVVAAIPRGGLAVALPIAERLRAPITLAYARKLTIASAPEFALGAVDEDGEMILDHVNADSVRATRDELDRARQSAHEEIARERERYRSAPLSRLAPGASAVLVDDGLATGLTMLAAAAYARRCRAREIVVAVPCAAQSAVRRLQHEVDRVVALVTQSGAFAVGSFYDDFEPVSDGEAMAILERARRIPEPPPNLLA